MNGRQDSPRFSGKRFRGSLYGICMGILFACALLIGLFLTYYSACYSFYSSTDYERPIYLIKDQPLLHAAVFAAVCLLAFCLNRLFDRMGKYRRQAEYLFLGLCCALYAAACLIWVSELPYYPSGDQLNATAAAHYNLSGNFIMFKETGYIGKFPYQKGLTFLYEILFRLFGDFCYPVAARLHILLGVVTMIFGYLFVEETSWHGICKVLYAPLLLLCTPFLILTPYTYGDLPSVCFCTVLFWALLRFARTERLGYAALGCVMAALSLLMRMHTWIVLIALLIGMFLTAMQKRTLLPLLAGLLVIASAVTAGKLLDYSYALRSGYEPTSGAPMILTLAMGLQENRNGPGTYNDYQTTTMSEAEWDHAAAKAIARENIQENLDHFTADPAYARYFFKTKLLMQWIEPSFETLISTYSFDEERPVPEWIDRIYTGDLHDLLLAFANGYQSLVYLGFALSLPVLWKQRKESAARCIPLIAIVGGFLFSVIWESQCRYVLPYYLFMLLYVPEGVCFVLECAVQKSRRIFRRVRHPENTAGTSQDLQRVG
ncbi:MAG: glycosyltransferase family 39 protein [Muribaculum sp.]|nr:glycosyltransferase family 39 protein [Muribaculum sp.]